MSTQGIKAIAKNVGDTVVKNSPTILTGLSVAGLITTTVMGISATPKAIQILEREKLARFDPSEEDTYKTLDAKEVVKLTWKCYIPTFAMGAVTIACIIGANSINIRRNAALASLYSLSETALKEYQAKVVEVIGKNKEKEIKEEVIKDKIKRNPVSGNEVIITGRGETLCYDALSGRYFKSDTETINAALNMLSRKLMSDMFISLNQVYDELGLEGTKLGDLVGWHIDQVGQDLIQPDFSTHLSEDGRPCLVLDFEEEPKYYDRNY